MRQPTRTLTLALLALAGATPRVAACQGVNVSTTSSGDVRTCDDLSITFDERPAVRAARRLTAPRRDSPLNIRPPQNGGVYVLGSDRSDFEVLACMAADAGTPGGQALLGSITASLRDGTVTAAGPDHGGWLVFFVIEAPNDTALDIETSNGPASVQAFKGRTTVRSETGPIRLFDAGRQVTARAQNGNGPVAIGGTE